MIEVFRDDKPKEECGVVGIYTPGVEAAKTAFFALFALQHRGQESAGIAVSDGSRVRMHKELGLVNQVFTPEILDSLKGEMAIGHTRYSTTGRNIYRNAQPIFCQTQVGEIAVAHNGNLVNTNTLRKELIEEGEQLDTSSDTELIARILVRHWHEGPEAAVAEVMRRASGAYSVVVLTPKMIVGFRDPYGNRPLSAGRRGNGYMLASETCAFGPIGAIPDREVEPGEIAIIDQNGLRYAQGAEPRRRAMCLFEFIYFARPDSRMYGTSLYSARQRMGEHLARDFPVDADIVVPVPDRGIPAALGYANVSGIPFREGMMKSRYIHRTFIEPDQAMRDLGVRMKLTPLEDQISGKRIVLVDDSIVRGTTTGKVVGLLRESGAKEVHVRITAPTITNPCFYGIDMARKSELAAANMTIDELRISIGADSLGFLSVEGAVAAVGKPIDQFCVACFNGDYPIPIPEEVTKHALEGPSEAGEVGELATLATGQPRLLQG